MRLPLPSIKAPLISGPPAVLPISGPPAVLPISGPPAVLPMSGPQLVQLHSSTALDSMTASTALTMQNQSLHFSVALDSMTAFTASTTTELFYHYTGVTSWQSGNQYIENLGGFPSYTQITLCSSVEERHLGSSSLISSPTAKNPKHKNGVRVRKVG